jgi:hypothetical protein
LVLFAPARSGAVTLTWHGRPGPLPYQRWADTAKVPTVQERVRLSFNTLRCRRGRLAALRGCALWKPLTVVLAWQGRRSRTVRHELGHIFDFVVMGKGRVRASGKLANPGMLGRWTPARRMFARYVGRRQKRGTWAGGYSPVREEFAEAYRACARNPLFVVGRYGHNYHPGTARHRGVCALINREYVKHYGEEPPASP